MIEGKDYWIKVKEESALMRFWAWVQFWNPDFLMRYHVTVFRTIYSPGGKISGATLEHELQHIRDFQKYHVWYLFSYAFLLPFGWTMRAHWERRGYMHNIRAWVKRNRGADTKPLQDFMVREFCTSRYFWMWPNEKAVRQWVVNSVIQLEKDPEVGE